MAYINWSQPRWTWIASGENEQEIAKMRINVTFSELRDNFLGHQHEMSMTKARLSAFLLCYMRIFCWR